MTSDLGAPWTDWEIIAECTFPVPAMGPEVEDDCGEAALYKVSWGYDGRDYVESMTVCQKHLDLIAAQEK